MRSAIKNNNIIQIIVTDLLLLGFIYIIPALSHAFHLPLYYLDPMRIALFSAIILTNKKNAYLIALSLPLISFLISGHPVFPKFLLISVELFVNVLLIFTLLRYRIRPFFSVFIAIAGSKALYYLLKFLFLHFAFLKGELISTPLLIQVLIVILYSVPISIFIKKHRDLLS